VIAQAQSKSHEVHNASRVIDIPPNFERDVLGGRYPGLQINVDATISYLFFATAVGIFPATIARTMPRLRLLYCW
jgi:hypothetical protein